MSTESFLKNVRRVAFVGGMAFASGAALATGKLEVKITACPHPDLKPPKVDDYSGLPAEGGGVKRIEYKKLDDIVVYVEPVNAAPGGEQKPPAIEIDLSKLKGAGDAPLFVVGSGGEIVFKNKSRQPQSVYSVSEAKKFSATPIAPGAEQRITADKPGLIDILSDATDEVLAQVYVAPCKEVRMGRCGDTLKFSELDAGRYRVVTWHRVLPGVTREVVVEDKKSVKVDATVGMKDADLPQVR